MAKLIINEENKRVVLSRKSMDIFRDIWGDVFMREFTSAKNRRFRM